VPGTTIVRGSFPGKIRIVLLELGPPVVGNTTVLHPGPVHRPGMVIPRIGQPGPVQRPGSVIVGGAGRLNIGREKVAAPVDDANGADGLVPGPTGVPGKTIVCGSLLGRTTIVLPGLEAASAATARQPGPVQRPGSVIGATRGGTRLNMRQAAPMHPSEAGTGAGLQHIPPITIVAIGMPLTYISRMARTLDKLRLHIESTSARKPWGGAVRDLFSRPIMAYRWIMLWAAGASFLTMGSSALDDSRVISPRPPLVSGEGGAHRCELLDLQDLIGRTYSEEVAERARATAGAATVRPAGRNYPSSSDYIPGRLNIQLNDAGIIVGFRCG